VADLNLFHDPIGHTLTVWFGAPQSEYVCVETGDGVILMKDRQGWVIGIERINYRGAGNQPVRLAFITVVWRRLKCTPSMNSTPSPSPAISRLTAWSEAMSVPSSWRTTPGLRSKWNS